MNALGEILRQRIALTGPLTLADFMAECLLHPAHGYYTTSPVFGSAGDFTTAPEISQMFGELLGLSLAQCWMDQGSPAGVLAEAGPGRGTLMVDVLRATRKVPALHTALRPHLVEASPKLRALQRQALGTHTVAWVDQVGQLPEAPLFFLANEFLDALPIRQFQRDGAGWRERLVSAEDGALRTIFGPPAQTPALDHRIGDTRTGDIVEICPALPTVIGEVAGRIARHGGAAILVDYGDWRSLGDTFQAVRAHRPVDPLAAPGEADLTAHVDFEAVASIIAEAGAAASAMVPQGVLLERLGITARAQALAASIDDAAALENHLAAHRRLTHRQEMGSLFKAIAIHPQGSAPPPGFDK